MNNDYRFDNYAFPDMSAFNNTFFNQMKQNKNNDLATPLEGYIRGNLYNNLYKPYKNYRPANLVPTNEQAELLLNLNQLDFAAHELRLYLDVFPTDRNMIQLFNKYQQMSTEATNAYEKKFGPLNSNTLSENTQFSWQAYAWPWEMEEM